MNAVYSISATSACESHCWSASFQIAFGYLIGVHAPSSMREIAAATAASIRAATLNRARYRRATLTSACP